MQCQPCSSESALSNISHSSLYQYHSLCKSQKLTCLCTELSTWGNWEQKDTRYAYTYIQRERWVHAWKCVSQIHIYTGIKHKWGWGRFNANHASSFFLWGKLSKYPFQIKCMSLQYVRELPDFCFKQGTWKEMRLIIRCGMICFTTWGITSVHYMRNDQPINIH